MHVLIQINYTRSSSKEKKNQTKIATTSLKKNLTVLFTKHETMFKVITYLLALSSRNKVSQSLEKVFALGTVVTAITHLQAASCHSATLNEGRLG